MEECLKKNRSAKCYTSETSGKDVLADKQDRKEADQLIKTILKQAKDTPSVLAGASATTQAASTSVALEKIETQVPHFSNPT
jgi:K+/H+ antiporter YhaU regulatory subunit KhtT